MSTSNMAWIDASSVKLGCIGFRKTLSTGNESLAACKTANSKAHLIEVFNDDQSRFLMSEKVRNQVRTHIGIDTYSPQYWWIGAELKMGTWYWEHSKKQLTYWSRIGGDHYGTDSRYPYAKVYLGNRPTWWTRDTGEGLYPSICQI